MLLEWPPNAQLVIDSIEEASELKEMTNDLYAAVLPEGLNELYLAVDEIQNEEGVEENLFLSLGIFGVTLIVMVVLLIVYCILKSC